jgi:hypothetical protein
VCPPESKHEGNKDGKMDKGKKDDGKEEPKGNSSGKVQA